MGKPVIKLLLGALAGLLIWMIMEPSAPTDPFSSTAPIWAGRLVQWLGVAIGVVIGGYNGWLQGSRAHTIRGIALGGLFGFIGASLGAGLGSTMASALGGGNALINGPLLVRIPVRIIALAPIGLFLGAGIGASTLNWRRAVQGAIGGLIGGGLGAALFDPVSDAYGTMVLAARNVPQGAHTETGAFGRALFCVLLGAFIGLFVGIIEAFAKAAWLRLAVGRNEGKEWAIDSPVTIIGRSETAQVPLFGDTAVAQKHASITKQGDQYLLADEGSQSGTYLNGQRVTQSPLFHGAIIQVGGYRLEFLMKVGTAPQRAAEALRAQQHYALQTPAGVAPFATPTGTMPYQPGMGIPTQMASPMQGSVPTQMSPVSNVPYPQSVPTQMVSPQPAPGMSVQGGPTLAAITGPLTGQRFPISGTLEVGREGQGVSLGFDTSASRKHASFALSPDGIILSDLGSTNGTFVNDLRVQAATLVQGDLIRIGVTTFRIE